VTVITGPATDNEVGRDYIRAELRVPAHNALREAPALVEVVREALQAELTGSPRPAAEIDQPALAC
jgi:hypothetical protein